MSEFDEPELSGYEPIPRRRRARPMIMMMRVVVVLAIIGLVLPGVLVTLQTASRTAERGCAILIAQDAPGSVSQSVRFELLSPIGPGWNCYSTAFGGHETLVKAFGLIPVGIAEPTEEPDVVEPTDS
jgi:hypothetical protein